jgi:hypothetical protein
MRPGNSVSREGFGQLSKPVIYFFPMVSSFLKLGRFCIGSKCAATLGKPETVQLDASLMVPVRELLVQLETPPGRIARLELH